MKSKSKIWLSLCIAILVVIVLYSTFRLNPRVFTAFAQTNNFTARVNGNEDNNIADDKLTLREAILISEGNLGRLPTTAEQVQILGTPGEGKLHFIFLEVDVKLDGILPEIKHDGTIISSATRGRKVIDGQGNVARGIFVTAKKFDIGSIEFRNFLREGLHIVAQKGDDPSFTLTDLKFDKATRGLVFNASNKGKMDFTLSDSEFENLNVNGVVLNASVGGDYEFRGNKFGNPLKKLGVETAAKLSFGQGAGDISVTYSGNIHATKNGRGSFFEEIQHTGKIKWEILNNQWLGGQTGLESRFLLEGEKNFFDNEYKLHTKAGFTLKTMPLQGVAMKINLDSESMKQNGTGWNLDVRGNVEMSTRLFEMLDNNVAVDGFIRGGATGFWKDRDSRFEANIDVGVRLLAIGGVSFDLFYQHDLLKNNGRGMQFKRFKDSIHLDDTTIISNKNEGIEVLDSHIVIKDSAININGKSGLVFKDSDVDIELSRILSNGQSGIALQKVKAKIVTSLICFNKLDGINIKGNSDVLAYTDIIDRNGNIEIRNLSPNYVYATQNDWGPITQEEMDRKPYPSNISRLFDVFDSPGRGFIEYAQWKKPGVGCSGTSPTITITPTPSTTPSPTISLTPILSPTLTNTPTPTFTPTTTLTPTITLSPTP